MGHTANKLNRWNPYPEVLDIVSAHELRRMERGTRLQITLPYGEGLRLAVKRTRSPQGRAEWHICDGQSMSGETLRLLAEAVQR